MVKIVGANAIRGDLRMLNFRPSGREQFVALVNRVAELLAPDEGYDELAERVWGEWVRGESVPPLPEPEAIEACRAMPKH